MLRCCGRCRWRVLTSLRRAADVLGPPCFAIRCTCDRTSADFMCCSKFVGWLEAVATRVDRRLWLTPAFRGRVVIVTGAWSVSGRFKVLFLSRAQTKNQPSRRQEGPVVRTKYTIETKMRQKKSTIQRKESHERRWKEDDIVFILKMVTLV